MTSWYLLLFFKVSDIFAMLTAQRHRLVNRIHTSFIRTHVRHVLPTSQTHTQAVDYYELDLARSSHRWVMQELLHLAAVEPGNNVVECTMEGLELFSLNSLCLTYVPVDSRAASEPVSILLSQQFSQKKG